MSANQNSTDTPGSSDAGGLPAQPYDFERPSRLSRDQIRRLDYLHASFAKRVSVSLAGLVRDYVEVGVAEVAEGHWSALIDSLPAPCAVFSFGAEPLEGTAIVSIDPKLAFGFVERLFGGKGEARDMERELTPIEQMIARKVADSILKEIEYAWGSVAKIRVTEPRFASSPDFIQVSGINESVVMVRLAVKTTNLEGEIVIGYPYLMFEPAIRAFVQPMQGGRTREPDSARISGILTAVPLQVSARLVPSHISMKHLVDLGVSDVLLLDNHASDDVEVLVEGRPTFAGRPVEEGGRIAVKVTQFLREGGK